MDIKNIDLLFENNPNPMWAYNPDSYAIEAVNQAAVKLYGYGKKEFTSLTIKDLRPEGEVPKLKAMVEKRVQELNDAGIWKHKTKEGNLIYVRIISHPINVSGEQYKLVTAQDATKEVQLKQSYLKEKELLEIITEKLPGTFFIFNKKGQLLRWNKNMERLTGYSKTELEEQPILSYFKQSETEKINEAIEEVFEKGSNEIESEIVTKNGETIPFLLAASKATYNNEQCVVGIGINISNLKELLRQKEVLLSEIHHRVKNNLAVISGLLELELLELTDSHESHILNKTQARILVMAQIFELLYHDQDVRNIRFDKHVNNFVETIKNKFGTISDIGVEVGEVNLNINQAIPFSLLLNEIFYAVLSTPEQEEGNYNLQLNLEEKRDKVRFKLGGNYRSPGSNQNKGKLRNNYNLVDVLLQQLKAEMNIKSNGKTNLLIEFDKQHVKGSAASVNIDL